MCEDCNKNWMKNIEDLKDVKGFHKIVKPLGNKKYEDLSGQRTGKLVTVRPVGRNNQSRILWLCECDCSGRIIITGSDIKRMDVRSCGCLIKDTNRSRRENLEGKVFTRWTVIKDDGENKVFCKCSCGTERWVDRNNLRQKISTSCGCLRKELFHDKYRKVQVGQVYGRLTIKKCLGRDKNKKLIWEAECSCGNVITTTSDLILSGSTRSCGCLKRDKTIERCTKPMVGKTFSRLKVIRKAYTKKGKGVYYECLCSCGNTVIVQGAMLRSGNSRSCGCLAKENREKFEDLTGQRFGKLVVLGRAPKRNKEHDTRFRCKCDCGGIIETLRASLINGEVISCGCVKSKGEYKISTILAENNIVFEKQKSYDDLRGESCHGILRYDFYIPKYNYLIEYDGEQHFKAGKLGWNNEEYHEKTKKRDKIKNEYCRKNNIPLIRIPYTQYEDLNIEDLKLETTKFRVM